MRQARFCQHGHHFTIAVLLAMTFSCAVVAQDAATAAIEPAFNPLGDTSWYDSSKGSLIPVPVKDATDDSVNRHSRWLPKPRKIQKPKSKPQQAATTTAGGTGTGLFGTDLTIANVFGWLLLAICVVSGVGLLVYALTKAEIELGNGSSDKLSKRKSGAGPDEQTIERMKHLPAELRRTDVNLRTEAMRLMNEGQFDQAIILLFGHQLLMLDHAAMLRLTRGKTNGRYVRETRTHDRDLGKRLRLTATAFERSYFGRHQITASEFNELWQNNEMLEQRMHQRQEVAA